MNLLLLKIVVLASSVAAATVAAEEEKPGVIAWTKKHERSIRMFAASALLFHGGRYSHTMLLVQTLKVTAGPLLKEAAVELATAYGKAREEMRKQAPEIEEAKAALVQNKGKMAKIHGRVRNARVKYLKGDISKEEYQTIEREQRGKMWTVIRESDALRAAASTAFAIAQAVDGDKLKKLGSAVYAALTAGIASATSKTAATAAVGLGFGNQLATTLRGVVLPLVKKVRGLAYKEFDLLPPTAQKWVRPVLSLVGTAVGVFFAYQLQHTALTYATCYFASGAILATLHQALPELPLIEPETPAYSAIHVALASLGFFAQIARPKPPPFLLAVLLKPVDILEVYLKGLTMNTLRASPLFL